MKRVFSSQDPAALAIVCGLLSQEGIETTVLNQNMSSVSGQVPFVLAMPEVWIVRDEDEPRAMEIVESFDFGERHDQKPEAPWICPRCGETIEGQFTECWKCGAPSEQA